MAGQVEVARIVRLSHAQRDDLFRASPAGTIPDGAADGTVLLPTGAPLPMAAAKLTRLLAWQGKVFDAARGELRNRLSPLGVQAVTARVFKGPSWLDGRESIALDYARTSLVARRVRDEIREVAPGVYLGIAWWDRIRVAQFVLTTAQPPTP